MKLSEEDIKLLMREQTARSGARQSECLTEDQFLRALTGEASKQERARAAAHMAACADCAEEYHILRSLRSVVEEAEPAGRVVTAHAPQGGWRQAILSALSPARAAFALAASLLIIMSLLAWLVMTRQESSRQIAALNEQLADRDRALESTRESLDEMSRKLEGTTTLPSQEKSGDDRTREELARKEGEIARLRRSLAELSEPQLGVPIVDLDPSAAIRGGPDQTPVPVEVPAGANIFTVILNFTDRKDHTAYAVEILNSEGREVWGGQVAKRASAYSLNLTLSRRLVPEGRYLIKLYGLKGGERELVADYSLQLRYR